MNLWRYAFYGGYDQPVYDCQERGKGTRALSGERARRVDEIVIVDTGSSDATKEIAARYTDRIYDFEWIDDFSAARNYAFEQATGDYLLWLDADDVLLPTDAAALPALQGRTARRLRRGDAALQHRV